MIAVGDARRLPFPDATFDLIFTSPPWDHLELVTEARPEFARVLTRKGKLVMVLPHLDDPRLATLAVANRDWSERSQWVVPKPDYNRGWTYRSLADGLVRQVLQRARASRVLDPFAGTGTVVRVARAMRLFAVGCDVSPAAARIAAGV